VFTLRFPPLPAQARRGVSPRAPAATSLERLPPRRVLVVDDDQDNLDAARWILEEMGQHVEVAASGSDAIGRSEAGERYDLVLCDLGMPGLNGWDVALRLREIAPATPVYLVTGWAQELGPDDPRRANVAGILPKPIDVGELGRIVRGAGSEPLAREDRLA
jgi:CheY-like chemotaxis protein